MGDIYLTPEGAELANRIRTIDHELDTLEAAMRESVVRGLHSSGSAMGANLAQTPADKKHADLLTQRADLVRQLKISVAEGEGTRSSSGVS